MFFSRPRPSSRLEIWPTFVDVLSTVLMAIVFVMMTVSVAQIFLVETINDRDTELAGLREKLRSLETTLSKAEMGSAAATSRALELEKTIADLNLKLAKLTEDLALETRKGEDRARLNETLKLDLAALESRLRQLNELLELTKAEATEKDAEIKKLRLMANEWERERAKQEDSLRVNKFRSEFFSQLQRILGDRDDIRVVGDRFVFQSEVLFGVGSAELGLEGKARLDRLITALKEIGAKIPDSIPWILRVDGHTDKRPINSKQFPSNWELSSARAIAVTQYMIKRGIDGKHLVAAGFGEHQPLADIANGDLDKDRRIEFKLDQR